MKPVLNVGVVIESHTPSHWVGQLVEAINTHESMRIIVGLSDNSQRQTNTQPTIKRKLEDWLLERVIDKPHFSHDPWQPQELPADIEILDLAEQPSALAPCDVILYLTSQSPTMGLPDVKVPVWTADLPFMDLRIKLGLLNRAPFLWIHLWNLQRNSSTGNVDSSRITSHSLPCQTYSISDLRTLSYSALPNVFMSRLTWLINHPDRKLDSIEAQERNLGVFETDQQHALIDASQLYADAAEPHLTNNHASPWRAAKLLLRQSYERIHHKIFTEHWQLAISHAADAQTPNLEDITKRPVHSYNRIAETTDVMWADPHLVEHLGEAYVFFEKMHKHNENAHIAYAKLDEKGQIVDSGIALTAEHHLSFPFVFEYQNGQYMIPETASLRGVNLYKATRFPDQWEHHKELLSDFNAADTVLLQHELRWWMFTNCQTHRSVDERDELHIYYADNPEGPWHPHAQNPVLTGVDRSRMAGPIIHEGGKLYRSSQYGAYRYGYGINISQIDELTPRTYRESARWRILPHKSAGWSGCHTVGQLGNLTIIDRVRFSRG